MQTKTLWLINHYASSPDTGMGGRSYYMAKELAKQGHKVYLIAASFNHKLRAPKLFSGAVDVDDSYGFSYVRLKVGRYKGSSSKRRILNWFVFSFMLWRHLPGLIDKPDAIVVSSPSLVPIVSAKVLAEKYGAKLIFEVRDIWPLTLMGLGGYSCNHPFIRFLQWLEDYAYRVSDCVVSNLPNSLEHMTSRGMDAAKFSWVPNGFSMEEVMQKQALPDAVLAQIPKHKFIVGYTGSLGVANSLDTLIDAAVILKAHPDIAFVLVGGGKEKTRLEALVAEKELGNVWFIEPIPKGQIQSMLIEFDVCFIGWKDDDLYRFGIAANKIPEYFFSGKPVVHAYSGCCDPVGDAKAGITVRAGDSKAVADAVLELYLLPEDEREAMSDNGHRYAIDNHEYAHLAKKFSQVIFDDA